MEDQNPKRIRSHKRGKLKSEVRFGSSFRTQVVEEYLKGDSDQRVVAARHGISQSSLSLWIKAYLEQKEAGMAKHLSPETLSAQQQELNRLRKELEAEKLRSLALEELIIVAEEQLKVQIRKKPGARQ